MFIKIEGVQEDIRGHVPYQGGWGSIPTPVKRSRFFSDKCKKYSDFPFFIPIIFCIVTPSLSSGSNEIFIRIERKNSFFLFLVPYNDLGGGVELRGHVP